MIQDPQIDTDVADEFDLFLGGRRRRRRRRRRRQRRSKRKIPRPIIKPTRSIPSGRRSSAVIARSTRTYPATSRIRGRRRVVKPRSITKPIGKPPIRVRNTVPRSLDRPTPIATVGIRRKPMYMGVSKKPLPLKKLTPIPVQGKRPPSRDIILPYKRRYGSGRKVRPNKIRTPEAPPVEAEIQSMEAEFPPLAEEMTITKEVQMNTKEGVKNTQTAKEKRNMMNIAGLVGVLLLAGVFVVYKMKNNRQSNGRIS